MRAVNLMPRDERRARLELGRLPLFAAAGGVVAVTAAAFLLSSSASSSADETKAELQAIEAAIDQLPAGQDTDVSSGVLVQERSSRVAALAAALSSRTAFDRVLRDISLVMPEDAWLTQLQASAPLVSAPVPGAVVPPGTTGGTSSVTIKGATFTHDSVATVLARLSVVPTLTDVRLTSTALVDPRATQEEGSTKKPGKPFVTFDVSATVKTGDTQ
jgi:Tfp pilus assembly protein PilN